MCQIMVSSIIIFSRWLFSMSGRTHVEHSVSGVAQAQRTRANEGANMHADVGKAWSREQWARLANNWFLAH